MSSSQNLLLFRHATRGLSRRSLRDFAERLSRQVAGGRRFVCLVTGDAELEWLNRQFLGKNYPADVLSFPEPGPDDFLGEIAISLERARDQAKANGHALEAEVGILMLHGLLHLLGMDHERDRGTMARAESRWRKALGLPPGLVERTRA